MHSKLNDETVLWLIFLLCRIWIQSGALWKLGGRLREKALTSLVGVTVVFFIT